MVSRTEVILFARQALLPAKAYPFSKFPLKALYKAVTIQYGLRDISHVLIQLKGQAFGCLIPAFTFSRKLQWMVYHAFDIFTRINASCRNYRDLFVVFLLEMRDFLYDLR